MWKTKIDDRQSGWLYNLWPGCILISIRNRSRNIYKSIIMISDYYCNRFQHNRSPSWAPQCHRRWWWRWWRRQEIKQSPMQFAYAHKQYLRVRKYYGANIYATLAGKYSVIIIRYFLFLTVRQKSREIYEECKECISICFLFPIFRIFKNNSVPSLMG